MPRMDGIDWASSAMVAARTRLEIATGNLANVSSEGFRKAVARGVLSDRGVRIERTTSTEHGALRHTGRAYDLAIAGNGAFRVRSSDGTVSLTRNGSFSRDRFGVLRDDAGRALLGVRGAVRVPDTGAAIDERGKVLVRGREINRLPLGAGSSLHEGFVEEADVDGIGEMIGVLSAERSFESAQKVVAAIDRVRRESSSDVARVK
jgi:flagellar basal-body rod protein FlgF